MRAFPFALLVLSAGVALAEAPARTLPKTWSKRGWQNLKWGMGPADVEKRLKLGAGAKLQRGDEATLFDAAAWSGPLAEPLFRQPVRARLEFVDQGLRLVELALAVPFPNDAQCQAWFFALRNGLMEKHGPHDARQGTGCFGDEDFAIRECAWRADGNQIQIFQGRSTQGTCSVSLRYADREFIDHAGREMTVAPELPGTPPKSWSKQGWTDLKWGMGPGDVEKRARLSPGQRLEKQDDATLWGATAYAGKLAEPMFREPVRARFEFAEGALRLVHLTMADAAPGDAQSARWFQALRNGLFERHRAPDLRYSTACFDAGELAVRECTWLEDGSRIELFLRPDPAGQPVATMRYTDRAYLDQVAREQSPELLEAHKRELDKL